MNAEKADSFKKTIVNARLVDIDNAKQITTLSGGVTLDRGTLGMTSDKAIVSYTSDGYQMIRLLGNTAKVTFRQKRDGDGDQWIEGEADRVEYDEKAEMIKLFSHAQLRRLEAGEITDQVEGAFISYDSRNEFFSVRNSVTGLDEPGGTRNTITLYPKRTGGANDAPRTSAEPAGEKR